MWIPKVHCIRTSRDKHYHIATIANTLVCNIYIVYTSFFNWDLVNVNFIFSLTWLTICQVCKFEVYLCIGRCAHIVRSNKKKGPENRNSQNSRKGVLLDLCEIHILNFFVD